MECGAKLPIHNVACHPFLVTWNPGGIMMPTLLPPALGQTLQERALLGTSSMCLRQPSFYPTNFLGPPPTVTGGGWKAREWGDTLSTLSLSLHTFLSFMCPHSCMLAPVWAPGTEAIRWTLIRNIISCVHDTHWLRQPQGQYRVTVTWLLTCHVLWLFASTHLVQNHRMHPDTPVINK